MTTDTLARLIDEYKANPDLTYQSWFLHNEDRLKAFRSIRRGVMQVVSDIKDGSFPNTTTNTYGFYSLTPARATGEPFRLRSSRPIRPTSRTSATATGPKPLTKLSPRKRSQHPARK